VVRAADRSIYSKPAAGGARTAMEFAGLSDADSRKMLIDYLEHAQKVVLQ